jgi:hypothetical protein
VGKKKKEKTTISGMPRGTANSRLRKKLLFELLCSAGINKCFRCGELISLAEDLAIEHVQDWRNNHDLFWDSNNIAFSHLDCSSGAARQEKKLMLVDVAVEDEYGQQLPTFHHDGQIFVAGKKGDRYHLRVTNRTGNRVEVVITVDGRDVISGKKGDYSRRGYVLGPFGNAEIKGFRQNDSQVAAFRFSKKGGSYSSKKGTPENVGIIGVAVFNEKYVPPAFIYQPPVEVHHHHHHPTPVSIYSCRTTTGGVSYPTTSGNSVPISESFSVESNSRGVRLNQDISCDVLRSHGSRRRSRAMCSKTLDLQSLGTQYGESIHDSVGSTSFTRDRSEPAETWTIWYDSMSALRKKGVPTHKCRKPQQPQAFPDTPYIAPGCAKPPPR